MKLVSCYPPQLGYVNEVTFEKHQRMGGGGKGWLPEELTMSRGVGFSVPTPDFWERAGI